MRKQKQFRVSIIISILMMAAAVACSPTQTEPGTQANHRSAGEAPVNTAENTGHSYGKGDNRQSTSTNSNADLSEAEIEGLLYMREEEKLAGDVYRFFHELWGNPVFENIASSEDMHTESIQTLLNRYGIADPASAEAGVFQNADLQTLYNQLTAQGSQSLRDSLLAGAAIEEIDILDLKTHIAESGQADIISTYENLLSGSENHLRAFVNVLSNQYGENYSPQYMTQAQYNQIMEGQRGAEMPGGQRGGQGNGNGRGGGLGNGMGWETNQSDN